MGSEATPSAGFCQPPFDGVRTVFEENLTTGKDLGASLCITIDGDTVVDLWGGFADADRRNPWQPDTLVNVYSTTKTMTALLCLMLADQGALDLDAPVAACWPEFAQNDKHDVLIRHVLSHSAGLPDWDPPIGVETLLDWQEATDRLAAQPTAWPPGTAPGYHSLTQGYLLGEVVRRITGETIGTLFRERVARPLDADFFIGLPAGDDHRAAEMVLAPDASPEDATGPLDVALNRRRDWRAAEIPAANGWANARSIAGIHRILANGGVVGDTRFLSEETCRRALQVEVAGEDRVLGMSMQFGLGFAVSGGMMPNASTLYWGGYGGSLSIIDLDARTTFAYAMNQVVPGMGGDDRALELAMTMWEALGLI